MATIDISSSVDDLGMTRRTSNALKGDDIRTVGQLIELSGDELSKTPNLGSKSLREVQYTLAYYGFTLREHKPKPKKKNFWVCALPEHHEAIKAYAESLESSNGNG